MGIATSFINLLQRSISQIPKKSLKIILIIFFNTFEVPLKIIMNIKRMFQIAIEVSEGKDNFKEGAIGYCGYSFVFKDMDYVIKHIGMSSSGGICWVGKSRKVLEDWNKDKIKDFNDFLRHNKNEDLLMAGSVKTLVPSLTFGGGYEHLFEVWMFIKTADNKIFPATLHYGQSGLVIGGWDPKIASLFITDKNLIPKFPKVFSSLINCSPHDFNEDEKEALAEALELALRKVPVSDFFGVYQHDFGNRLMGIKNGKPVLVELGISPKFDEKNFFLNKTLKLGIDRQEFEKWDFH